MASQREERERLRQERLAAQKAASSTDRRRLYIGYAVAALIVAAIVAGIVVVVTGSDGGGGGKGVVVIAGGGGGDSANCHIQEVGGSTNDVPCDTREGTPPPALAQGDLQTAADAAGCELKLGLPDEGNKHIGRPSQDPELPDYKTNPPTSGNHIDPGYQQNDGAYTEKPNPEWTVHSMEHGRVLIQYSPDLSEADQLALKGVFDESSGGMLLFPNPDMPYEVAVTAWTNLMGCKTYDGAATLDAIRDFRDSFRGQGPEPVAIVTG
jgi:hypothetical protein